jgi:hypothetical protein
MIKFTKHAEEAVEKRQIALDWIDRAIAMPDFTRLIQMTRHSPGPTKRPTRRAAEFSGLCIGPREMTL